MKLKIMMYFSFLLVLFIYSCSGKPTIEFNEVHHNFGDAKQNTELKHVFIFKNIGSSTLVIEKIKAGWGCTGVLLSNENIPAGGEGKIEVTLKIGKRRGKVKKSVYVYTNDDDNKRVKLTIEVKVSPEKWYILPFLLAFYA